MRRADRFQSLRDWQNIGHKLPLLTTVLLLVAVSAISWTAYRQMKRVTVASASEHVSSVSRQIAGVFADAEAKLRREGTPLSRDPAVRAALLSSDAAVRKAALARLTLRSQTPPVFAVELWNTKERVLAAGATAQEPGTLAPSTSLVGPLLLRHDTVLTDVRAPVLGSEHDTLGFVRELSRVSSTQSRQLLVSLIGGEAILLVGNAGGDVWTNLDTRVDGPTGQRPTGTATEIIRDGEPWIGAMSPVSGTPWLVWVARPEADILGRARSFLMRILVVALAVVLVGAIGARSLSRHVIAPLASVRRAAEAMADGDYSARVVPERPDEVGRVAEAFNTMASAIETASQELENQQVELEAQQVELEESNEELRQTIAAMARAREAADRAGARAAAIVLGALDAIVTVDADDRIVEFNPAAERIFGWSATSIIGKPFSQLVSAAPEMQSGVAHLANDGNGGPARRLELDGVRHDGSSVAIELSVSRVPVGHATMYTCFIRDLSDRKQLEAQLRQAQKMEAVGRLAGGVAHDFNNMLTVMISYTDLVLADSKLGETIRGDLRQVRSAADRAATLTRQLLAFSRKQVLRPSVVDVNEVVGGVITMLARVMPENIRLSSTLGSAVDPIFVDRGQLEQVLMNLAVNARDALPKGGSLSIETSNEILDDAYLAMHGGGSAGRHVVLSVRDTGIGMDAATRERIFEPFFTTKPVGQGTGLGLATVYGIVRQSGGSIYVYSEPDRGTTFKVYFPAHLDARDTRIESTTALPAIEPLRVLLVEDDPAVRDAAHAVLRSLGHQVASAPDVATALGLIRDSVTGFDVVLTDAVMPGQSGLELAKILRRDRPDLPVILMSGYAEEAIHYDTSEMLGVPFVEKPFTAATIARALADVRSATQSVAGHA